MLWKLLLRNVILVFLNKSEYRRQQRITLFNRSDSPSTPNHVHFTGSDLTALRPPQVLLSTIFALARKKLADHKDGYLLAELSQHFPVH